jgi:hypothetical protein
MNSRPVSPGGDTANTAPPGTTATRVAAIEVTFPCEPAGLK